MATHHILVLDATDWINLAECRYKQKNHPGAKICTRRLIKDVFKNSPTPHKLHISAHGDPNSGGEGHVKAEDIANAIFDSGIKDDGSAKVRLDICGAGQASGSAIALAKQIKTWLKKTSRFGSNCRIEVTGPIGSVFLGWDPATARAFRNKGRMVMKPEPKPSTRRYKGWQNLETWYKKWETKFAAQNSNLIKRLKQTPEPQLTEELLRKNATDTYTAGLKALKEFYVEMTTTYRSQLVLKAPFGHPATHKKSY